MVGLDRGSGWCGAARRWWQLIGPTRGERGKDQHAGPYKGVGPAGTAGPWGEKRKQGPMEVGCVGREKRPGRLGLKKNFSPGG
jgi:hypothetical protein